MTFKIPIFRLILRYNLKFCYSSFYFKYLQRFNDSLANLSFIFLNFSLLYSYITNFSLYLFDSDLHKSIFFVFITYSNYYHLFLIFYGKKYLNCLNLHDSFLYFILSCSFQANEFR